MNQDINKRNAQYFYLHVEDAHTEKHTLKPVGVIAFRYDEDKPDFVKFAASVVSRKEPFVRSVGVDKAVGRLDSQTQWTTYPVTKVDGEGVEPLDMEEVLMDLGLDHPNNYFDDIRIDVANAKFDAAYEIYQSLAKVDKIATVEQ